MTIWAASRHPTATPADTNLSSTRRPGVPQPIVHGPGDSLMVRRQVTGGVAASAPVLGPHEQEDHQYRMYMMMMFVMDRTPQFSTRSHLDFVEMPVPSCHILATPGNALGTPSERLLTFHLADDSVPSFRADLEALADITPNRRAGLALLPGAASGT
jgi:hypothetical protein